jgi:hypothetical protein
VPEKDEHDENRFVKCLPPHRSSSKVCEEVAEVIRGTSPAPQTHMILDTMLALSAWIAGFAVLYDFLRQMVVWALLDFEHEDEELFCMRD